MENMTPQAVLEACGEILGKERKARVELENEVKSLCERLEQLERGTKTATPPRLVAPNAGTLIA
jgi:hypothetical protein